MSEHDEDRPLTRRERRLREMVETGALDLSEALAQAKEPVAPAEGSAAPVDAPESEDAEEEISAFRPDGTPRSRREMRELREAAQARAGNVEVAVEEPAAVAVSEPIAEPVSEALRADEVSAPATEDVILGKLLGSQTTEEPSGPEADLDFDSLMTPPTEPFSVEEIREAERFAAAPSGESFEREAQVQFTESDVTAETSASLLEEFESAAVDQPVEESESDESHSAESVTAGAAAPEDSKTKRRFPWSRNKGAESASAVGAEASADASVENPDDSASAAERAAAIFGDAPEFQPRSASDTLADFELGAVVSEADEEEVIVEEVRVEEQPSSADASLVAPLASEDVEAPSETSAEATPTSETYSFPDIVPPEEWRSVFDDPASRRVGTQPGGASGDFDDLISRAVAQEGAAAATNTSALILPGTPDDTDGLSGPLGATGELYITGSIELPRSLGETGGHASLHDSLQFEPFTLPETPEPAVPQDDTLAPVSAKSAVSARVPSGVPVVAKPTKEQSKLPLILGISGGGLVVVIVGLGVWGVTSGLFSG